MYECRISRFVIENSKGADGVSRFKTLSFILIAAAAIALVSYATRSKGTVATVSGGGVDNLPRELNLYAMSNYFPDEVLRDFESKHNAIVRYDNFSNNEELLAKLQAGATGYDVIVPSDYMVTALIANHLLLKLDTIKIPNLTNIGADFRKLDYDKTGEFSVPYMWGTTGIVYNSKFVKNPTENLELFFKAEYKGRVALLEDAREAIGVAMRKLGYSGNSRSHTEVSKAAEVLIKLKPNVRIFTAEPKQHLQSEDVWIAQAYSGDAMTASRAKPELKYFVPKEGATLWIDNFAIPAGARSVDLAHEFINFILEPQIAAKLAQGLLYSTPNAGADLLIADEYLKASHIKVVKHSKVELLKDLGPDMQVWDDAWTKIKSQ